MNLFGLALKPPTLAGFTRAGIVATVLLLVLVGVTRLVERPVTGDLVLAWWAMSLWAGVASEMGVRFLRSGRETLIVLAGDVLIFVLVQVLVAGLG